MTLRLTAYYYGALNKNKLIIMKKFYLPILFAFVALGANGQEKTDNEKFDISVAAGYGGLLNSNLSPYGLHYRNNYNGGIIGNVNAFYKFTRYLSMGGPSPVFLLPETIPWKMIR